MIPSQLELRIGVSNLYRIPVTFYFWQSCIIPFRLINNITGSISNKIALDATPVMAKDFMWSTTLNFASNRNKIVALHEDLKGLEFPTFTVFPSPSTFGNPALFPSVS